MVKLRLRFAKTGKAVWMSHLDLMRTMQRALMRAGVPLAYSAGFNPHALLSIALPLPVGTHSRCEVMDFGVLPSAGPPISPEAFTGKLPEGVEALEIYEAGAKFGEIKYLRFRAVLEYGRDAEGDAQALRTLFSLPSLLIDKKTKRGITETDIAPFLVGERLTVAAEGTRAVVDAVAVTPELSPAHLLAAVARHRPESLPISHTFFREEILRDDFSPFR